jgi:hypothetical protein
VALAAWTIPACAPRTPIQRAGEDQEIVRDICWELRKEPRFDNVAVFCVDHVITLSGRVDLKTFSDQSYNIALSKGRGAQVVNRLEVQAR